MGPRVGDGHILDQWRSVGLVFQGGFMVFHGFGLVSIVFQGGFMVFHGFWLVSVVFQGIFKSELSATGAK